MWEIAISSSKNNFRILFDSLKSVFKFKAILFDFHNYSMKERESIIILVLQIEFKYISNCSETIFLVGGGHRSRIQVF